MRDDQLLPLEKFKDLSLADQREYLRGIAEHLAEAIRIHSEMTHPRMVPNSPGREQ